MKKLILLPMVLILSMVHAQTIHRVGLGQQFVNIQQAYDSIPATISGPFEIHLMQGYVAVMDSIPLRFDARAGASAINTVTIVPQVSGLEVAPVSTGSLPTLILDSCSHLIIDGRVGGVGEIADLRIRSVGSSINTVRLEDVSNTIIRYCDIAVEGGELGGGAAIKIIGEGCTGNVFQGNVIHSEGAFLVQYLITAVTQTHGNSVVGNQFYDCGDAVVRLEGTCSDWMFEGNHIYQGASSDGYDFLSRQQGAGITITGNHMGGSGPFASGEPFFGGRMVVSSYYAGLVLTDNVLENWNVPQSALPVSSKLMMGDTVSGSILRNLTFGQYMSITLIAGEELCSENLITDLFFRGSSATYISGRIVINNIIGDSLGTDAIRIEIQEGSSSWTHQLLQGYDYIAGNVMAGIRAFKEDSVNASGVLYIHCMNSNDVIENNMIGSPNVEGSISIGDGFQTEFSGVYHFNGGAVPRRLSNCMVSNVVLGQSNSTPSRFYGLAGDTVMTSTVKNINVGGYVEGIFSRTISMDNLVDSITSTTSHGILGIVGRNVRDCTVSNLHSAGGIAGINTNMSSSLIYNNLVTNLYAAEGCAGIKAEAYVSVISHNMLTNLCASGIGGSVGISSSSSRYIRNNTVTHFDCPEPTTSISAISGGGGVNIRDNIITELNTRGGFSGIGVGGNSATIMDTVAFNLISEIRCSGGTGIGVNVAGQAGMNLRIHDNVLQNIVAGAFPEYNQGWEFKGMEQAFTIYTGNLIVYNNLIQSIINLNPASEVTGLGSFTQVSNNIVRLGMDRFGDPTINRGKLYGINNNRGGKAYNNTVYLHSTGADTVTQSACIRKTFTLGITEPIDIRNNILVNRSSNTPNGSGNHFTYLGSSAASICNYNIHLADGEGGVLASYNNGSTLRNSISEMQAWANQANQHTYSYQADPLFIAPDADTDGQNMSLFLNSVVYGNALDLSEVQEDFFHSTRPSNPTIGAIENLTAPCLQQISVTSCQPYLSPSGSYVWTESGTYLDTVPNQTGCDSLMLIELTMGSANASGITINACESVVSPSGLYTWSESGNYIDTISNIWGCDSVLTIALNITEVDTGVTAESSELTADAMDAAYQWLDCSNGFAPIANATSQTFTPSVNGIYAVEVTVMGCTQISDCRTIEGVGIGEVEDDHWHRVYPNPTSGLLQIDLHSYENESVEWHILDVVGRLVLQSSELANQSNNVIDMSSVKPGVYTLRVHTSNNFEKVWQIVRSWE